MTGHRHHQSARLEALLVRIARAEEEVRMHDGAAGNRDRHAEAAQRADEIAGQSRLRARRLIEEAFPGVSWEMIERAAL